MTNTVCDAVCQTHMGRVRLTGGVTVLRGKHSNDTVVIGDKVAHDGARITRILPRTTLLARHIKNQTVRPMAANCQHVFIVLAPDIRPEGVYTVDAMLAAIWGGGMTPILCLNKCDLGTFTPWRAELADKYAHLGIATLTTSATTGANLQELRAQITHAALPSALLGLSGSGKSSLINALVGEEVSKTNAISARAQAGRHTTTSAQAHTVRTGNKAGVVFDLPGMRNFFASPTDIARGFPDMAACPPCAYRNCRHEHEPDCGVQQAVRDGQLPAYRLRAYRALAARSDAQP